jgi:hypothetical protein
MSELPRQNSSDARDRTCAYCGMVLDNPDEFLPHVFCVAKKAGRDPWEDVLALGLGKLPPRPPRLHEITSERKAEIMGAMEEAQRVGP